MCCYDSAFHGKEHVLKDYSPDQEKHFLIYLYPLEDSLCGCVLQDVTETRRMELKPVSYTHLDVYKRQLLDGSNKIKEYVARVKELGMTTAAITDHGAMFGVIDFYRAARAEGIKPILGCEVYVAPNSRFDKELTGGEDRYYHLVLLAENNQGYANLMKIVSRGYVEGFYYRPRVDMEVLSQFHEGIIALSACLAGEMCIRERYKLVKINLQFLQPVDGNRVTGCFLSLREERCV